MFQHTAARRRLGPKINPFLFDFLFQHTAARRRLALPYPISTNRYWFQHTAARRRLVQKRDIESTANNVSTHSRPKAAGS